MEDVKDLKQHASKSSPEEDRSHSAIQTSQNADEKPNSENQQLNVDAS